MPALHQASLLALLLVGTLVGCGDDEPSADASASSSPSVSATATPSSTPTSSASVTPTQAPPIAPGCRVTGKRIPDGSWQGPITMDVEGGGDQSGYQDSRGTGRMTLTVTDGAVVSGTWRATWKSHGDASTGGAEANVDFTGTANGTAKGAATRPVLPYAWEIDGIVKITKPQQVTSPFDETGSGQSAMTIRASACDQVTGTFVAIFKSKETAATFKGTAEWVGTRR